MSLSSALQIGRTSLLNSQTAIQTVGNNLANAGTSGYHRQTTSLATAGSQRIGQDMFLGQGAQLQQIGRQIDQALEGRLRAAISDESASQTQKDLLDRIEAVQNEFSDHSLGSKLGAFFDAWNELANNPQDGSARELVLQQAQSLAGHLHQQRDSLYQIQRELENTLGDSVERANKLLDEIEQLNQRIRDGDNNLLDKRDQALSELAELIDISKQEHDNGRIDVYVGSEPIIMDGQARHLDLEQRPDQAGQPLTKLVVGDHRAEIEPRSGRIGAQLAFARDGLGTTVENLDALAAQLVHQVNRVHSQGQGTAHHEQLLSDYQVADADAALNSDEAELPFKPGHGSFRVHVHDSTGQNKAHTIDLNLDGMNPPAATTLNSLAGDLDAIEGLSATVRSDGRLQMQAEGGRRISFRDDSSGALAALGLNTFFKGEQASDIAVSEQVSGDSRRIAAAQEHSSGDNRNALAIAKLRDQSVDELAGQSLTAFWNQHSERLAHQVGNAREQHEANVLVRENLSARQQEISGVNIDEETIDLMTHQRGFQASARFLSAVDEMMQTLLGSV